MSEECFWIGFWNAFGGVVVCILMTAILWKVLSLGQNSVPKESEKDGR